MATITLPAIVAILGALIYALAGNSKAVELGRIAYAVGLLVCVMLAATKVIKF